MRFVFPLDMEVPYGQVMLSILIDRGFVPELVIEEESPEAEHHRSLFLDRLGRRHLPLRSPRRLKNATSDTHDSAIFAILNVSVS